MRTFRMLCRAAAHPVLIIAYPQARGNNSFTRSLTCSHGNTQLDMLDEQVPRIYQTIRCRYHIT